MKIIYALLAALMLASPAMAQIALPSVNKSGTITTGGTFQTISADAQVRSSLDFQNICSVTGNCNATTDVCYLHFGTDSATTANSLYIPPGGEYLRATGTIPNDTMQVTCTTTGDKFYLKVQ